MRIVFMGTPAFASEVLRRLVEDRWDIAAVYTQPDKPKNRGMKLLATPVKEYALSVNIPVYQPASCRDEAVLGELRGLEPDVIVVAAYGKLLPQALLDIPRTAIINVHSSILPQYRGAAPINWAVLDGEAETGVSIMYMEEGLDTGDVILQRSTPIGETEDAQALTARLAELGAEALSEAVEALARGTASRTPQDHGQHTYAPMLSKELSPVDWGRPAHEIGCQVRGLIPWPCATTDIVSGEEMKLYAVSETGEGTEAPPGTIVSAGKQGIGVACGDGKVLRVTELQAKGGKRMSAAAYLLGHPIQR